MVHKVEVGRARVEWEAEHFRSLLKVPLKRPKIYTKVQLFSYSIMALSSLSLMTWWSQQVQFYACWLHSPGSHERGQKKVVFVDGKFRFSCQSDSVLFGMINDNPACMCVNDSLRECHNRNPGNHPSLTYSHNLPGDLVFHSTETKTNTENPKKKRCSTPLETKRAGTRRQNIVLRHLKRLI